MRVLIPEGPLIPRGRPSWGGQGNLPLVYLGWGKRDFVKDPLRLHYDRGSSYYVLLRGEILIDFGCGNHSVRGPVAFIFSPNFAFSITQVSRQVTDVLVWIWQGEPRLKELQPEADSFLQLDLSGRPLDSLIELHARCRNEVSRADGFLPTTLIALRELVEVELVRTSRASVPTRDVRWNLAVSWMKNNLSMSAPIPGLCDYLCMSSSTLHRFFREQVGLAPGAYFRDLKALEAHRLIREEGWQVKATAFHLGYRHANDLSRSLSARRKLGTPHPLALSP